MRLLFDLTDMYDHVSGMERYSIELAKAIMDKHPENEYTLFFKNVVPEAFYDYVMREGVITTVIKGGCKPVFREIILPFYLYRAKADVYCFFAFGEPLFFFNKNIYANVHDMSPWDCYKDMKTSSNIFFRATISHTLKYAKGVFTDSKFSAKRILAYANKKGMYADVRNKLHIIPGGVCEEFYSNDDEEVNDINEKYNLPDEYFLSVSTIEPRKNIRLLIKAYDKLVSENENVPSLVLSGRSGWKENEAMGKIPRRIRDKVIFTGFVDEKDLYQLYKGARAFICPSKYEGFGLPILEAMSARTLVISSDAASLPEVCGSCALMFKNNDASELVDCMKKVLAMSEKELKEKSDNSFLQAKKFNWQRSAEKVVKIIR